MTEASLENISADEAMQLFGRNDEHLRLLREKLGVAVVARAGVVTIKGEDGGVQKTLKIFDALRAQIKARRRITPDDVRIFGIVSAIEAVGMRYVEKGEHERAREAAPALIDMLIRTFK
jgi:phosphate starvation-inducible protein PhoH